MMVITGAAFRLSRERKMAFRRYSVCWLCNSSRLFSWISKLLNYAISFLKKKKKKKERRSTSGYLTLKWRKLCEHTIIVIASARASLCPPGSKRPHATQASQRSERSLALVTSLLVTGPRQISPQLFSNLTAARGLPSK